MNQAKPARQYTGNSKHTSTRISISSEANHHNKICAGGNGFEIKLKIKCVYDRFGVDEINHWDRSDRLFRGEWMGEGKSERKRRICEREIILLQVNQAKSSTPSIPEIQQHTSTRISTSSEANHHNKICAGGNGLAI